MLSFTAIVINSLSILLICIVIVFSLRRRADDSARQLIIVSVFMLIWAIGSFSEIIVSQLGQKIFWRNFTQIGTFYVPPATLIFTIAYTGILKKYKKPITAIIYAVQTASLLFILTDGWHHAARSSIKLFNAVDFQTLVVSTTPITRVLISFNFVYMVTAFCILILSFFQTAKDMKKQVLCVLTGMAICIVYSFIKISSNETFIVTIPISAIFGLGDTFMLLGIFRYNLLLLEPIARNEVFNVMDEGILIASQAGKLVDANRAAMEIFRDVKNAEENAMEGISRDIESNFPAWHDSIKQCKTTDFEIAKEYNGVSNNYLCHVYTVKNKRQKTIGSISLIRDVTEQKKNTDLLRIRAEKDGLTGVDNRKTFIEHAERSLKECDDTICLLFIDIDFFKSVNDNYGHIFGDNVLIKISELIEQSLDEDAFMGRMGGEEFAVFCRIEKSAEAIEFAESLRTRVSSCNFAFEENPVHITISIGIAFGRKLSFDTLYRTADMNLYKAKQFGRNCVRFETV